ncbi:zinc finger and SCAN domain-containing protein 10 [Myripristis murdjan]|uniref:Si:ch211-148l7.4 n=1 Tax=Myripristis murdjan TaxID=586833 RepID=A0A667X8L1_9TELE|nr:zinc finger and SCAN domain-containing protein 10-like [Myripristis murdjan]XP_029912361.1 zinc finger and SCAN domain-containing protein 10-like [Myripristis murdjan]
MDGVPCSWSATRAHESFSRSRATADTLSRLAKLMARAEHRQDSRSQRQHSSYVCAECGKSFPDTSELLHHQEVKHALPKPHQCLSCGKEFSLLSSLQLHKCARDVSPCQLCHGEPRLGTPCPACMTGASDPERPKDKSPHRQAHLLDSSPYACAPCGRGFSQKQALLYHQQAGCSEPPSPLTVDDASSPLADSPPVSEAGSSRSDSSDTPGPSSKRDKPCPFCSRKFLTVAGLQSHKRSTHAEPQKTKGEGAGGDGREGKNTKVNGNPVVRPKSKQKHLSCRSCDMVFRSTAKLYLHRKEKHSREKSTGRESRPVVAKRRKGETFSCQVCSKVFLHHLSLLAHSKQHAAANITAIQKETQPVGCTAKDSKLSDRKPNKLKTSLTDVKTAKAGPGRPNKRAARAEEEFSDPGRFREVPEVQEVEEEVDREFPCPSCAEVFSLQSQLRDHVELHQSSVRRRQCSVCALEMDTSKGPGSKRQRLYHCVPCQQGFSALDTFLKHCQDHLRVRVEEDSMTENYNQHGNKN